MAAREAEALLLHHLFDDGMAAVNNVEQVALLKLRPAVIPFAGQHGPAGQHVEFGQGIGRAGERGRLGQHGGDQLAEEFKFAGERLLLGGKDLLLLQFELLGHITFAADRGLLADIVGGDAGEVGLGHLDVITKDGGEADLEALDAGALLLRAFEFGQPGLVVGGQAAQPVEFGVVTGTDVVAVLKVVGQFVGQADGQ